MVTATRLNELYREAAEKALAEWGPEDQARPLIEREVENILAHGIEAVIADMGFLRRFDGGWEFTGRSEFGCEMRAAAQARARGAWETVCERIDDEGGLNLNRSQMNAVRRAYREGMTEGLIAKAREAGHQTAGLMDLTESLLEEGE